MFARNPVRADKSTEGPPWESHQPGRPASAVMSGKREEHTDIHRRISSPRSSEMAAIAGSRSQILPANGSLRGLEEVLELDCEELRRLAISAHKTAAEVIQRQRA